MEKTRFKWWWLAFQPVWWWWAGAVKAQVIINEVYPNPNTGEEEWVELYNRGEEMVELTGWELWDQLSTPSRAHEFVESTQLAGQEFLVINLSNKLNNGGDIVVLKDGDGQKIDQFEYTSSSKGKSWARNPESPTEIFLTEPSQGKTNPSPIPDSDPSATYTGLAPELSEVVACPTDADEWVELYNPHDQAIKLTDFSLRDDKNVIFEFAGEEMVTQSWLVVDLRNVLNNDGDSVTLISPVNQVVESFSYITCLSTNSWAKRGAGWEQTTITTKNAANIFTPTPLVTPTASASANNTFVNQPMVLGASRTNEFIYPPTVLNPKLKTDQTNLFTTDHIAFSQPPALERGAGSVIMGSLFLLIPGLTYVKNRQQHF
ncbi:MAG TPA: lamin tail domain-containing protein [Patescibacteria group bacterium]